MSFEGMEHHRDHREHGIEEMPEQQEFGEMFEPEKDFFVEVSARAFDAGNEKAKDDDRAVIFIPGWLMTARDRSVDALCRAYARRTGFTTYAVSTSSADLRGEGAKGKNVLFEEARGIAAFIRERGLREVIIAGHSRGGNEAIDVAAILQKEPDIRVRGLIPMCSAGIFPHSTETSATSLASAIPFEMALAAFRGLIDAKAGGKQMQFGTDMASNFLHEITEKNVSYPFLLEQEADEANTPNPRMREIHAPVVLVFGRHDNVASMEGSRGDVKALFPNAPSVRSIVADSGHMWPLEEPAEAARKTLERLETVH